MLQKDIGNYIVYSDGKVWSKTRNLFLEGRIDYRHGYHSYRIDRKWKLAHRLVGECFIENPKNLPEINHKDGNKLNNHLENLEWSTKSYNMNHAYATGLCYTQGENHPKSFLTEKQVKEIRELKNLTQSQIAKMYGVHRALIGKILNRKTWKHI
jgi:DNA-binding transcriptional regulator YiaG